MFNWSFKKFENRQKQGKQSSEALSECENWYFTFAGNSQNPKEFWN